ncbi:HAD family hydrolase [Candidatus Nitrososphaera sp. FF02]|uniref:HAD family hydrolase n=1 Tax=Candidatus Nitrososphaera sp. FF02 TaxID=3398226 RepID=UPI0039EB2F20
MALAAFDMDGTLIDGRLVFALAERSGLDGKVRDIQADLRLASHEKTKMIATLFAGAVRGDVVSAVESIPLAKNCEKAVALLKEQGWKVGIISDSYTVAAGAVAEKLGMDFLAANELEFDNGRATGRVRMPMGWQEIACTCRLSVCKRFHLEKYAKKFDVPVSQTAAIGDTRADICMVRRAAKGIAFMPKDDDIKSATGMVVSEPDMMHVVRLLAAHRD